MPIKYIKLNNSRYYVLFNGITQDQMFRLFAEITNSHGNKCEYIDVPDHELVRDYDDDDNFTENRIGVGSHDIFGVEITNGQSIHEDNFVKIWMLNE